jgi:hypothetical protein
MFNMWNCRRKQYEKRDETYPDIVDRLDALAQEAQEEKDVELSVEEIYRKTKPELEVVEFSIIIERKREYKKKPLTDLHLRILKERLEDRKTFKEIANGVGLNISAVYRQFCRAKKEMKNFEKWV